MFYVVYDKSTTRLARKRDGTEVFKSEAIARNWLTRHLDQDQYLITDWDNYYANVEAQVERVNLMSGQKYMESINTPGYMSPASESYWSM